VTRETGISNNVMSKLTTLEKQEQETKATEEKQEGGTERTTKGDTVSLYVQYRRE